MKNLKEKIILNLYIDKNVKYIYIFFFLFGN